MKFFVFFRFACSQILLQATKLPGQVRKNHKSFQIYFYCNRFFGIRFFRGGGGVKHSLLVICWNWTKAKVQMFKEKIILFYLISFFWQTHYKRTLNCFFIFTWLPLRDQCSSLVAYWLFVPGHCSTKSCWGRKRFLFCFSLFLMIAMYLGIDWIVN